MLTKCCSLPLTTILLVTTVQASQVLFEEENGVKSAVYLSPKFALGAGSVRDIYFPNIDFPRGHIAIKYFNTEVVDELGNPVPLHETYLHHWLLNRYYARTNDSGDWGSKIIPLRNSGVCQNGLDEYFGVGSETRQTDTHVPDPYGIQVGNPADIPDGYEEGWLLNVHAIDTRGVIDRIGCIECRCDLYNTTRNGFDRPYLGGIYCCHEYAQCRLRNGFENIKRNFYMRYTVKWVDWVDTILPVGIYILDVTDTGESEEASRASVGLNAELGCQIEYDIKACGVSSNECIDSRKTSIVMPKGGQVIFAVGHQHYGAIGIAIYGEDGRLICSSTPIYGEGKEAGNEAGYVVGMTSCYPQNGSAKISPGGRVVVESHYNNSQMHTGVMGLIYLLIAHEQQSNDILHNVQEKAKFLKYSWALVFLGVALAVAAGISRRRNEREEGYQSVVV